MSEVKCYSLDVYTDSLFDKNNPIKEKFKKSAKILNKYNCLGFNPDPEKGIEHCLFGNPSDRYFAFEELMKAGIKSELNPRECFVDEKYLE